MISGVGGVGVGVGGGGMPKRIPPYDIIVSLAGGRGGLVGVGHVCGINSWGTLGRLRDLVGWSGLIRNLVAGVVECQSAFHPTV